MHTAIAVSSDPKAVAVVYLSVKSFSQLMFMIDGPALGSGRLVRSIYFLDSAGESLYKH